MWRHVGFFLPQFDESKDTLGNLKVGEFTPGWAASCAKDPSVGFAGRRKVDEQRKGISWEAEGSVEIFAISP